jgi:hypothetical protein
MAKKRKIIDVVSPDELSTELTVQFRNW